MKKLFAVIIALVMCAAMGTSAFAASGSVSGAGQGDKNIDVSAKYTGGVSTPDVYSVDVAWGAMEFTYAASGTRQWNAANHTYTDNTTAEWTENGNTVTVTNHSNKAVTAAFAFAKDAAITDSITGGFTYSKNTVGSTVTLAAGVENQPDSADKVVATLKLTSVLGSDKTELTKVGTITVTLG